VNRLGAVARRHGYGEACLRIINSLYGFNAMEVQEAFIKIREQVRRDTLYKPLSRQRG
jgi:transformation/transcription domain-associated protein